MIDASDEAASLHGPCSVTRNIGEVEGRNMAVVEDGPARAVTMSHASW